MWPDWAIYYTLGNFSKPRATINLPKSPTHFRPFCKGVKIFHLTRDFLFGWTFIDNGRLFTRHTAHCLILLHTHLSLSHKRVNPSLLSLRGANMRYRNRNTTFKFHFQSLPYLISYYWCLFNTYLRTTDSWKTVNISTTFKLRWSVYKMSNLTPSSPF